MYRYQLSKEALSFLKKIPTKHARQIVEKIDRLCINPQSIPSKQLEGYPQFRRIRSGEYRVIYRVDGTTITIYVLRIGKRNDGEVYDRLENISRK